MKDKIKVVWICSVSNPKLRDHLDLGYPFWHKIVKHISGKKRREVVVDYAQWNSNAIDEFEKIEDVELHVIFAHKLLKKNVQRFIENDIHYYAVKEDEYGLIGYGRTYLFGDQWLYARSNRTIAKLVKEINPDIVHMQGAEMLAHSPSLLLLPRTIPCIVQLETMLQAPEVRKQCPNPRLDRQRICEYEVLKRADYIGYSTNHFYHVVRDYVKNEASFVNTRLIIGEKGDMTPCDKVYDFTYFANYINKSVDLAIEAFGIAHQQRPELTLDIIGSLTEADRTALINRLNELGCKDSVKIEGRLKTHDDVIAQIKKAKFALLPLKIDVVSSTIREAMWNGLPVITTRTVGTPLLNEKRESVLISEIGDHAAMADNMLKIAGDSSLAEKLRNNAAITVEEMYGNNEKQARQWLAAYHACINHFKNGVPLPNEVVFKC